jgi:hypothetical protein
MLTFTSMIDLTRVRLGEPDDEEDLVDVCRAVHAESPLRSARGEPLRFCETKVRAMVREAVRPTARNSWVGIIGARGNIEASVCLAAIQPSAFSQEMFLGTTWNFVMPAYRETADNAKTLLAFAKEFSHRCGIHLLIEDYGQHKGRRSFYERGGCQPFGGLLLYSARDDSLVGA